MQCKHIDINTGGSLIIAFVESRKSHDFNIATQILNPLKLLATSSMYLIRSSTHFLSQVLTKFLRFPIHMNNIRFTRPTACSGVALRMISSTFFAFGISNHVSNVNVDNVVSNSMLFVSYTSFSKLDNIIYIRVKFSKPTFSS